MLPNLNLDKERFHGIADSAIKSIYKYAPQWSDYNAHDPGITLIELLAFMTEAQQYHLNQVSSDIRLTYLDILGESPRKKRSSSTLVTVKPQVESITLAEGTRLRALDVGFETELKATFTGRVLIDGFSKIEDKFISFKNQIDVDLTKLNHEIFGKRPRGGEEVYFCFDKSFSVGREETLYVDIFDDYSVKRNPLSDDFVELSKIRWEYLGEDGFVEITDIKDGTHAFLYDGKISFKIHAPMKKDRLEGQSEGFWLRATFEEGVYDIPPILACVAINVLKVHQRKTLSVFKDTDRAELENNSFKLSHALVFSGQTEVYYKKLGRWFETNNFKTEIDLDNKVARVYLGQELLNDPQIEGYRAISFDEDFVLQRHLAEGDGFPYQEYELDFKDIMAENLCIMAENEDGGFEDYSITESFVNSSPEDLHFSYKEDKSIIYFGDCQSGFAPLGKIKIISARSTKGLLGNVKEGQINQFEDFTDDIIVTNRKGSVGGNDTESTDECFVRLKRQLREVERAVTNKDYETIVKRTGGLMIKDCMVLPADRLIRNDGSTEENSVSIVVEPFSANEKKRLSVPYIRAILNNLDNKKLIGTSINILSPEYIGVMIIAEIEVKPYYRDAEDIIENAIREFFDKEMSGFGKDIYYNTIYGLIDSLECVSQINSLVVDAQGKNIRRTVNGDIKLMPNAVAYLMSHEFVITSERE